VPTVVASRLAAREEEQSWRAVDHDAPDVFASFGDTRTILNVKLEIREIRHLLPKSRRIVLAPTSLREFQGLRTVLTSVVVHHHRLKVTIRHGVRSGPAICFANQCGRCVDAATLPWDGSVFEDRMKRRVMSRADSSSSSF
jgi:hypothetical protein